MKEKRTMEEMNEQYKDCPMRTAEYEVDGKKYIVHSHFVGTKDLDEVIGRIAFDLAMNDSSVTA